VQLNEHFADDVSLDTPGSVAYDRFIAAIHVALHLCMILDVIMKLRNYWVLLIVK
jgi:hypothetical protein